MLSSIYFFFSHSPPTEIYTLSLHDALPISLSAEVRAASEPRAAWELWWETREHLFATHRSEEHTSELQSRFDLVCRLLLEKKKKNTHRLRNPMFAYTMSDIIACNLSSSPRV